ncbi:hypothetical protein B0J13DRAFT_311267 [Dactylonectria estremocensis]|uniref:Uncharacterized protein n=1 Tax=Dactylonectria estremocensis TaxID=1079267 RepID=A0A9P9F0S7_9HYPO|nr:hypothetical protein B0J13DRAFT_311267 [Dactylonectria estremocensis]
MPVSLLLQQHALSLSAFTNCAGEVAEAVRPCPTPSVTAASIHPFPLHEEGEYHTDLVAGRRYYVHGDTHTLEPADPCSSLRTGLTIVGIVNPGRGCLGLVWATELLADSLHGTVHTIVSKAQGMDASLMSVVTLPGLACLFTVGSGHPVTAVHPHSHEWMAADLIFGLVPPCTTSR